MPLRAEDVVGEEWAEWYRLSPQERFADSMNSSIPKSGSQILPPPNRAEQLDPLWA
jgi:hypothetical protein